MELYKSLLKLISRINDWILNLGRRLACGAMALMVFCILLQIFYRYVLNNALPWPEEAARGLMIWMMAVIAPSAYRYSGFVSIEMIPDMMPAKIRSILMFAILMLCTIVICIMFSHAWAHFSAPLLFDSSGLNRLLQDSGLNQLLGTDFQFKTAYIYLAMSALLALMLLVSLELILRQIGSFIWPKENFISPHSPQKLMGD